MDAVQSAQRDHFQQVAEIYDSRYFRKNANHIYKITQIEAFFHTHLKGDKFDFLELGAGTGIHAEHFFSTLQDRIRTFTISDLSSEMLEVAKQRMGNAPALRFLVSGAEDLQTGETYDGVFISGALHHFSSPKKAIQSIRRHIRPGGFLVICEPVVWSPVNFLQVITGRHDWGQFGARRSRIRNLLVQENFDILTNRVLHWKPPAAWMWPYRELEKIKWLDPFAIMYLLGARLRS